MAVSTVGTPVINRKTLEGATSRVKASRSTPLISGMRTSEMMMSKSVDWRRRFAASPLQATSTRCPSLRNVISRSSQMERSSSTTSMWAIFYLLMPLAASSGEFLQFRPFAGRAAVGRVRQFNAEFRAALSFGRNGNAAAVGLHTLVDDRQSEARSSAEAGLQWLKNLRSL